MIEDPRGFQISGGRLERAAMPNLSQMTFNPVQTDMVLNLLPDLGVGGAASGPRIGFDNPAPEIPVVGRAQITGNKLRSGSSTGAGVQHEVGFGVSANKTLVMDYADAKIRLPWNVRERWMRNIGAIGIDQLLAQVAAETVANTDESDFVSAIWVLGNWTTQYATGTVDKWTNYASNPVKQIATAKRAIKLVSGKKANHLVIPQELADALLVHPKIRSYRAGGQGSTVDQQLEYSDLARILKLDKVTVADRVQNSASDLLEASISLGFTLTDGALLFADYGPSPIRGTAFCRAHYNGLGQQGVMIQSGENQEGRYDYWNIARQVGYNILDAGAGAFFEDLI